MHADNVEHLAPRLTRLEGIVTGDGREMGIGPMVLQHEEELTNLNLRVRKLEDNSIRTAAFVGGAVFLVEIMVRVWDKVKL